VGGSGGVFKRRGGEKRVVVWPESEREKELTARNTAVHFTRRRNATQIKCWKRGTHNELKCSECGIDVRVWKDCCCCADK